MKSFLKFAIYLALIGVVVFQCNKKAPGPAVRLRGLADTVGFAHTARQMDSVMARVDGLYGKEREAVFQMNGITPETRWKLIISPHDDYSYAGDVYPYVTQNLSAPTLIIFGVAHKARLLNIADKIVFDQFTHWRGPYGRIPVSPIREEIMSHLPPDDYLISDSLQEMEHSVEALLPFIQYYHRNFRIVSILVPYMSYQRMQEIAPPLARAIADIAKKNHWQWGKDFALAISNDCVHYGDQDWGGKNLAPFGADSAGYQQAVQKDMTIISECLIDELDPQKVKRFCDYTVRPDNYKEYAWTWCGRYSVPFGLLTAFYLENEIGDTRLSGRMLRYSTSLVHPPIPVQDLGMGITAPANIHHWVGYVAIGYKDRW